MLKPRSAITSLHASQSPRPIPTNCFWAKFAPKTRLPSESERWAMTCRLRSCDRGINLSSVWQAENPGAEFSRTSFIVQHSLEYRNGSMSRVLRMAPDWPTNTAPKLPSQQEGSNRVYWAPTQGQYPNGSVLTTDESLRGNVTHSSMRGRSKSRKRSSSS